jgi:hypothetical protein|tara:strand:- start:1451 stop:2170 length:720 start_codon:yes stop_codon:yes gene_type:complete
MKYIVAGAPRSGTSMMMACLSAGGIKPYYDKEKEKELANHHPETNKSGFFERHTDEIESFNFPANAPDESAIKFLKPWTRLPTLRPGRYRIIIMKRDPREILHSLATLNDGIITTGDIALLNLYPMYINRAIEHAKNRKDMISVHVCDYRTFLGDPHAFFFKLKQHYWPLHINDAARVVNLDSVKSPLYEFPFSGDVAKDMQLPNPKSAKDAILDGTLGASEEVINFAKEGFELDLVAQ